MNFWALALQETRKSFVSEVVLGFEPRSPDSKSRVLTITPHNHPKKLQINQGNHNTKLASMNFWALAMQGTRKSFVSEVVLGFEPRSPDSESRVLTTTPHNHPKKLQINKGNHNTKLASMNFWALAMQGTRKSFVSEVVLGFEPRSPDSKSRVLTTTPHNHPKKLQINKGNHNTKLASMNFWALAMQETRKSFVSEVVLGFEPRSPDSESRVLTTTPHNHPKKVQINKGNHNTKLASMNFWALAMQGTRKSFVSEVVLGFEPRSPDSKSRVLTTTPHNHPKKLQINKGNHNTKLASMNFWVLSLQETRKSFVSEVVLGFEPRSPDSKSRVLTTTPHNHPKKLQINQGNHNTKLASMNFWALAMQGDKEVLRFRGRAGI